MQIILYALDATADGAMELSLYSPQTNVLVQTIRRYPDTCSVTGSATTRRIVKFQTIVEALESAMTAALPPFHAFTGADNTGS